MIKASSDHRAQKQAAVDRATFRSMAGTTLKLPLLGVSAQQGLSAEQAAGSSSVPTQPHVDITFDELPESMDTFVLIPNAQGLIQRVASLTPEGHRAIHSHFTHQASSMISHVECHGKDSCFYLDLSRVRENPLMSCYVPCAS